MPTKSVWTRRVRIRRLSRLNKDLTADVVVVGGGITGITAAYLLKEAGLSVVLLERSRCGGVDTSRTTAHITFVTDTRLSELKRQFGRDHARAAWEAGAAAMQQINEIVESEELDCEFTRVPGYLHAPWGNHSQHVKSLKQEAQLANDLGFECDFLESVPGVETGGIRFPNQAKFHPLKYIGGLLDRLPGKKCRIFEDTEVTSVAAQNGTLQVETEHGTVEAGFLFLATHTPLQGKTGTVATTLLQSKLSLYSSYVIGVKVRRHTLPTALFWDTSDPYQFLRVEDYPRHQYLIFGGEDHKTGQDENPQARFEELESLLSAYIGDLEVKDRWSGQVVETNDGLPLIGEISDRQFIATGYAGNGMTFGTLAAMMACDAAHERKNPWTTLFDVNRKKLAGAWDYIKENIDYPYYMIKDRLRAAETRKPGTLKRSEGAILGKDSTKAAVCRDSRGKLHSVSPVCTHMGCVVHWNSAEETWDCPCHGSRFKPDGTVIAGPAESPLESKS